MSTRNRRRGGGSNHGGNGRASNNNAGDTQHGRRNGGQRANADSRATSETPSGAQRRGSKPTLLGVSNVGAQSSVGAAVGDVRTRLERIRATRPKLRQQFIREGRMNPDGQMHLKDAVKLIGICTEMCPEYERVRRIVENDFKAPECTPETEHLHRSQRIPDESRMVKAYARSAAGVDVELVSELRSPATCLSTIDYLFDRLDNDDFEFLQAWIWDRTRAVRKDLRTQSITSRPDIKIYLTCLERIARYHLISMHQMAKSKKSDYDHQQDLEQLNQTIMSLKERYADNRRAGIPSDNEAEFWAIRLILAPQYVTNQLEYEVHRLPSDIRNNGRVQVAIELYRLLKSVLITGSTAYIQCQANWKKLWELVKSPRVSYLMACAAEVSFNRVRHVVLDCLWRAYRRGNVKITVVVDDWTTDKLKDALGLDTDQEAVTFCENFGFEFSVNKAGQTFLDLTKKGYAREVLSRPLDVKPQSFSGKMVEIKRHGRAFSAIIHGMSVQEAKAEGYIIHTGAVEDVDEDSTLFVPEKSIAKPSITNQQPDGVDAASTSTAAKTPFSLFASAFQPSNAPAAAPNPFLKAAEEASALHGQNKSLPAAGSLTSGIQPGLFDASKNPIQFSTTSTISSAPISSIGGSLTSSVNLFLKGANTPATAPGFSFTSTPTTTQATNPFTSTPSATQAANPFTSAPSTAQAANPFASVLSTAQANPFAKFAPTTPQQVGATATPPLNAPFAFPTFKKPDEGTPQQPTQLQLSFTPTGPTPQDPTAAQDAAKQKTEQEKRDAAEKERQEAEARKRVLDAQRARAAQEAEQRKAAEIEQQKRQAAAEAEQRRRQLHADQERRAREEQERLIREEQQRQTQKEEARMAERQERDSAFRALTHDIMFEPEDGILVHYFDEATSRMARQVHLDEQRRVQEEMAEAARERRRCSLARAVLVHWVGVVQKRKKAEEARKRRARIKEQRRLVKVEEQTMVTAFAPTQTVVAETQPNGISKSTQPTAPVNAQRARRTKERRGSPTTELNGEPQTTSLEDRPRQPTAQTALVSTNMSNSIPSVPGYSQAYQKSAAPIDRTETDWFELRAMGLDPSKHRKRSFSYDSTPSEEETKKPQIETKRPKLSPTLNDNNQHQSGQPALSTEDDQLARFRAAKQAFRTSGSTLQLTDAYTSLNEALPTKTGPSTHKKSNSLIAKARDLVANSPTAPYSPPSLHHDWGRSVPNLGPTGSVSSGSVFGKSVGALTLNDRPAYWSRTSRFVPKHLYGQGAPAIQAYYEQYVNKSTSSSVRSMSADFPAQSSQIPTQQSYIPQPDYSQGGFSQHHYNENEVAGVAEAMNAFIPANSEVTRIADSFLSEDPVHGGNVYDTLNGDGEYTQQFAQAQTYANEASTIADMEEEEEDYEDEAEDDLDGDDYSTVQRGHNYVHPQEDSEYDEYDEYSDEEEEDEEEEEDTAQPVRGQYPHPASQQFGRRQPSGTPSSQQAKQSFNQAGTTEDDAIELSD